MNISLNRLRDRINAESVKKCAATFCVLLALSVLLTILMMVMTVLICDFYLMWLLVSDVRILFLNALPVFLVMSMLYFIINRIWISFSVTGVLAFVMAMINRFKMMYRDDPLVFEDLLLINEAKEMAGSYSIVPDGISFVVLIFIILIAVMSFLYLKRQGSNIYTRIAGALCSLIVLVLSCDVFYFNNTSLYNSLWHPEFGNEYKAANQSMSRGVVYSFIKSIPDAFVEPPEGYNTEEAEQFLEGYETVPMQENQKVHMISIMLEAYNDFSKFENVEFNVDPYVNFHALQRDSYSGDLFTDIFAGETIRTERQFLTGYRDIRFSQKETESYVRYFKSQGYYAEAMHPCYGWFYNRNNMNKFFGFDNFDYYENKYRDIPEEQLEEELYWDFISDYDFFDYIIEGYENAVADNRKYFNFSVTFQNHGPYPPEKRTEVDYLLRKDEYSEENYNIFNNYLDGIYKTDMAFKKLRDYIDSQSEPIVLILFGDHNPRLGNEDQVYDMLGIDLSMDTPQGAENYFETCYLFYANDAAKESLGKDFKGQGNTISPIFLMNEYFEYVGMQGPAYLNYLSDVKKDYEVINIVYCGKDGKYVPTSENESDEILNHRNKVEYHVKSGKIK